MVVWSCGCVAVAKSVDEKNYKIVAENRRARFDYYIESDIECGLILTGSEVKSLRAGGGMIAESYAEIVDGELWLVNALIASYDKAKTWTHTERRRRKLLASRRELARFWTASAKKGMALVPLVIYFNHKGRAKIKIAIAQGKKKHDKREVQAKRDWQLQKARLLRGRNG